jgi:hypothetical protein
MLTHQLTFRFGLVPQLDLDVQSGLATRFDLIAQFIVQSFVRNSSVRNLKVP